MDCSTCGENTPLIEIIAEFCGVDLRQIQKLGFQRRQAAASFTATTILQLSEWQDYLTATDDTKIVITPYIRANAQIEAGAAITTGGGDNSTLNGVEENEGVNPSRFSGQFKSLSPAVEKAIKALNCELDLTVYLFLQGGLIVCTEITSTTYNGITIQSFFLSDRNNAGFGTKDTFNTSFAIPAGWSENICKPIKPNFNPLTDL